MCIRDRYILWRLYRTSEPGDTTRVLALGLAWGGAAGNLIDRLKSTRGVVDFVDIGVGDVRFWTFNVADADVDKINDAASAFEAVDEIARRAAPGEPQRQHARRVPWLARAVQTPQDVQRDYGKGAEDVARVVAKRHAERRAGIEREREAHDASDDLVRDMGRYEIA